MVIETVAGSELARPSLARKVKASCPTAPGFGTYVRCAPVPCSVPSVGGSTTWKVSASPSASVPDRVIGRDVSRSTVRVIGVATGGVLGGCTGPSIRAATAMASRPNSSKPGTAATVVAARASSWSTSESSGSNPPSGTSKCERIASIWAGVRPAAVSAAVSSGAKPPCRTRS